MPKLSVMTVVGTRPEIIRLSALITLLDSVTSHKLVHTGQNSDRELNQVFFEDLGLRLPDIYLDVDTSSMGTVMGQTLMKIEKLLIADRPDALMILGDTNSAIASIVAERMQIPVYHMEAGNRSYDANVPEEFNRRMVDHASSFNLPYNSHSRANLEREGIHPRFICVTGSPIPEVVRAQAEKVQNSKILDALALVPRNYILASLHRQENVDEVSALAQIMQALDQIALEFDRDVILSTHPRTRARLGEFGLSTSKRIRMEKPFSFSDYNRLQMDAYCVISDSGTISEEASILGFPAVSLRESFERPEAFGTASISLTGLSADSIIRNISWAVDRKPTGLPEGYDQEHFSKIVVNFLFSTAHLHKVWKNIR